jgi:hypothetical protein
MQTLWIVIDLAAVSTHSENKNVQEQKTLSTIVFVGLNY